MDVPFRNEEACTVDAVQALGHADALDKRRDDTTPPPRVSLHRATELEGHPDRPVVICSTPAAADAAALALPGYVCVGVPEGADIRMIDWSALQGRLCAIWTPQREAFGIQRAAWNAGAESAKVAMLDKLREITEINLPTDAGPVEALAADVPTAALGHWLAPLVAVDTKPAEIAAQPAPGPVRAERAATVEEQPVVEDDRRGPDPPASPKTIRQESTRDRPPLFSVTTVGGASAPAAPRISERYVLTPLLPEGEVTGLASDGGLGKTMLALAIALHGAAGREWAGLGIKRVKAAFVSLEDPLWIIEARLEAMRKTLRIDAHIDVITPHEDANGELFGTDAGMLAPTLLGYAIAEQLIRGRYGLIVIDNASDAFGGNENSRREVKSFIRWLRGIARKCGAAVLLLAHVDKLTARGGSRASNGSSYSGVSAWNNSVRSRLAMFATAREGELRLVHEKSNWLRKAPPLTLAQLDCGTLIPIDGPAGTERDSASSRLTQAADDDADVALLKAMKLATDAGDWPGAKRSGPRVATMVLGTYGLKLSNADTWAAIDRAKAAGTIAVMDYLTDKRKRSQRLELTPAGHAAL